jgi:hypothetical protein
MDRISDETFSAVVGATLLKHADRAMLAAVLARTVEILLRFGGNDDEIGRALSRFADDLGLDQDILAQDMRSCWQSTGSLRRMN